MVNVSKRYRRQTVLPEIGEEGQKKLLRASVLCIGAGGLGSPALMYLAAAGVGKIGIVDFDTVDESNLQRQILFTTDSVGGAKAKLAKEKLHALNPEIMIETSLDGLNADNVSALVQSYDIIIDGTDNFETKFLINDACVKYEKPWVYGAIQGFEGQASVFDVCHGPCYRCLYPEKPKARIQNCAEAGVIGAVAGLVGVTQAVQVVQLIVGHESFHPLIGKLWVLDTRTMETQLLKISKNPNCSMCSKKREDIVLGYSSPVCGFVSELSPQDVANKSDCLILDVREQDELKAGVIENSQHYPLSKLVKGIVPDFSESKSIVVYCQKGIRSVQAAQIFKEHGFLNVDSLAGGYEAWVYTFK